MWILIESEFNYVTYCVLINRGDSYRIAAGSFIGALLLVLVPDLPEYSLKMPEIIKPTAIAR